MNGRSLLNIVLPQEMYNFCMNGTQKYGVPNPHVDGGDVFTLVKHPAVITGHRASIPSD